MSLYNVNTMTAQSYEMTNPTNSNPPPLTETGEKSDAVYRGPQAVPNPPSTMKGGYTYKRYKRKSLQPRNSKKTKRHTSVSSVLGMDVSYRGRSGGYKRRKVHSKRHRTVGMTLARGMTGGRRRRRTSRRSRRRMSGGVADFPTGYSTPINLSHSLSALANPVPYQPIQV